MVRPDRPAPGRGRRSATAVRPRDMPSPTASRWRRVAIALTGGIAVGLAVCLVAPLPVAATFAACAVAVALTVADAAREYRRYRRDDRARRADGIANAYDRAANDPWVTVGDDEVNVETGEVREVSGSGYSNEALLALTRAVEMPVACGGYSQPPPPPRPAPEWDMVPR